MKGVSTDHLRRLLAQDETVCQMVARLRQEKQSAQFALERLQTDYDGLLGGHKRWREEAVSLHRKNEASGKMLVELADSIERLLEIVEGCRGRRWAYGGTRLVDTPEWCAFYVAHQKGKRGAANKVISSGEPR